MASTNSTNTNSNAAPVVIQATPRDWLYVISIILAVIGLLISGYIVVSELTNTSTICPAVGAFNCDVVQHSIYSKIGPLPVAWLGLAGYIAILLVLLLENRVPVLQTQGKRIVFGFTLLGVLFSGYLTAIEAFVLHAWCIWCVGSAITMTVLFFISLARVWRSLGEDIQDIEDNL